MKSPWNDVIAPRGFSLPEFIFQHMARYDELPAILTENRNYTFAETVAMVKKVTFGLECIGVEKGDMIGTYLGNQMEFIWLWMAALRLGAVVTTCNPVYTSGEMCSQFNNTKVKLIILEDSTVEKYETVREKLPFIKTVIKIGKHMAGSIDFSTLYSHQDHDAKHLPHIDAENDIAFILYSSGTTGLPKGVLLSHQALVTNFTLFSNLRGGPPPLEAKPGDIMLTVFQYFHAGGFIVPIWAFLSGATQTIISQFDVAYLLKAIEKWKVTTLVLVPPVLVSLAKSGLVEEADIRSLQTIVCGAAPLGHDVATEASHKLHVHEFVQLFGMTELGFMSHMAPLYPEKFDRVGSCGMLIPNCEGKVVDAVTERELGPGEKGEMWLRLPSLMKGYLHNPEATSKTITPDGWMRTGDIAYYDGDGYWYIIDRLKELIKVRGFQVAPAELEAVILNHVAVADVIVVGVPDHYSGELPRAYVVLKEGRTATQQDIQLHVKKNVAYYKQLKGGVRFVKALPKTGSGKLLRRELRDQARLEFKRNEIKPKL